MTPVNDPLLQEPEVKSPTTLLKVGTIGVLLTAPAIFGLVYHGITVTKGIPLGWPSFGMHPVLMSLAFGLLMPLSALSYRSFERLLGVAHATAKAVHAIIMLAALICAVLGVIDMYIVHQNKKGSDWHFTSVHSYVGIMVVVCAGLQFLSGAGVYYAPPSPGWLRKAWMPVHVALGCFSLFGGLASIALGILSLDYEHGLAPAKYKTPEQLEFKTAGLFCCFVGGFLALVFASPKK